MQYRILIVDDHPVARIGLESVISGNNKFSIVAKLNSTAELLSKLKTEQIDAMIMDIDMPGLSGLEFLKKNRADFPNIKIILFTVHEGEGYFRDAVASGANGYVLKSDNINLFPEILEKVIKGEFYCSESLSKFAGKNNAKPTLTVKEHEVLSMLVNGLTAPEISDRLGITERTVYYYNNKLKEKFDAENLIELINAARAKYFI